VSGDKTYFPVYSNSEQRQQVRKLLLGHEITVSITDVSVIQICASPSVQDVTNEIKNSYIMKDRHELIMLNED